MKEILSEQITAVVLAGGFGRRVEHLLPDIPKPMAPVNGRPFLEWVVRYLAAQNIRRVILSTGHRAAVVEQHFRSAAGLRRGRELRAGNPTARHGGGISQCHPALRGPTGGLAGVERRFAGRGTVG